MNLNTPTFSAAKLMIQNGDDGFFRKGKVKRLSKEWFVKLAINLFSWINHCEKFLWIRDEDGKDELYLCGMDYVTKKNGKRKVEFRIRKAEEVINKYPGKFYWSPLTLDIKRVFDEQKYSELCLNLVGTDYDNWHFVGVAIDDKHINWLDKRLSKIARYPKWIIRYVKKLFSNSRDYTQLVCSEANTYLDEVGFGLLDVNGSEETPDDQAQRKTHDDIYYQFKGSVAEIPKFNTVKVKWSNK